MSRLDKQKRQIQRRLDAEYKQLVLQGDTQRQQRQYDYEQAIKPIEAFFELERQAMKSLKEQLDMEEQKEVDEKEQQRYLGVVAQRNENRKQLERNIVPLYLYEHFNEYVSKGFMKENTSLAYENVEFCKSNPPFMTCAHPMCSNRLALRKHHDNQIMCKTCKRKQRKLEIRKRRRMRREGERQWKKDQNEAPYGYNEYDCQGKRLVIPIHRHRCRVCGIYTTFWKIYNAQHWVCPGRCEQGLHLKEPIYRP
jgi:hypothetical protein